MQLNIFNPIEAIYLNAFALNQNIKLQIMATWVHLSTYLLFVISLLHFRVFNAESAASLKHTYLEFLDKKYIFFSKKREKKRKWNDINFT